MERHWINWTSRFLPEAGAWLIERFGTGGLVDMGDVVCVTPGRRAGRILLAQLARACTQAELDLIPPRTITPGALGEATLDPDGAIATRPECLLAWMSALREADTGAFLPERPADEDVRAWYALAGRLMAAHEELAGARLDFDAAREHAERLDLLAEGDRWRALGVVARAYEERLASVGLLDPAAAHEAALAAGCVRSGVHVVLLGVTDLNAMQRATVAALGASAIALVHAPASMADRFDETGCVQVAAWADVPLALADEQIVIAETPRDQADAALDAIAALDGAYAADEVTIGLGDPDLAEPLGGAALTAGLALHEAAGRDLRRSGPVRLLEAAAAWLEEPRAAHLAALARHPDLETWLVARDGQGELFAASTEHVAPLDAYVAHHVPERLGDEWPAASGRRREPVRDLLRAIADLLRPLRGPERSLGAWCQPVLEVVGRVYAGLEVESTRVADQHTLASCLHLREVLARHATAVEALQPRVTAAEAIAILAGETSGEAIAADVRPEQVEVLGWLELHLDPAPVLVLVGANDGRIPHTVTGDALLPDTLRRSLGLMHNDRFYARDAYLLEAMTHGRRALTVITGRATRDGDPLAPSRLLLAADDETMLGRVRRLCTRADAAPRARVGASPPGKVSRFLVPDLPDDLPLPAAMSVTAFKQYLECPYRFALSYLLRLEPVAEAAAELDALQFGTLAHAVLEAFGRDPQVRDERDERRIARALERALETEARARYGRDPMPAVRLQLARLARRLRRFARLQARWRAEGWRIRHVELSFDGEPALDVPGQAPMPIRGKVDRIDVNDTTGAWRIIDYKTGEQGHSPYRTHHGTDHPGDELTWCDLQLPLYRFLVRSLDVVPATEPELGYIVLPKDVKGIRYKGAHWTSEQLDDALDLARDVVRRIRAREFPESAEPQPPWDPFARICQSFVFGDDEPALEGVEGAS